MSKATEVELELLGLQESVEMLAAVAEIDGAVSPACLEIVQLCGREYILTLHPTIFDTDIFVPIRFAVVHQHRW